jgi:DNA-binding transcriptional LysR family regulator
MTNSNFHQLFVFQTVARLGGFSKAAAELSISQPAVSIQVKELEKTLGASLLSRTRGGVKLTDTGRAVYDYAHRIFALAEEMESAVRDIQGLKTGRLSIGSSTTPGEYILPWAIGRFRHSYPGIDVSLSISNTQSVVDRIVARELDLGMAGAPVETEGLASFPYVTDEIVIIASPGHALLQRPGVSPEDLQGQEFILREPGSATRATAEECLKHHGVSVRVVMELGSNEAVKRAAAAGLGLGVLSKFGIVPDMAAGFIAVVPVEGWKCQRPLSVFYREDKHLPAAQRAFLDFLREEQPLPDMPLPREEATAPAATS